MGGLAVVTGSHGGYFNRGGLKEMLRKDGHGKGQVSSLVAMRNGKASTMDRALSAVSPALGPSSVLKYTDKS